MMPGPTENHSVFGILLGMTEDLGEIKATLLSLKDSLDAHITDDKAAHARITVLEMRAEREKGFMRAGQLGATALGATAGYGLQFLINWLRHKAS